MALPPLHRRRRQFHPGPVVDPDRSKGKAPMFHDLTPDLTDPMLLAETTVPSIYEAAGLKRGELKVTYDVTLPQKQLRIKASDGAVYDTATAKRRIAELIETLDDALPPFRVAFLKSHVRRPSVQPWPMDLMTTVAGLQLFYLRAQACNALFGQTIQVSVSISMPKYSGDKISAEVHCHLPGEGQAAPEETAALQEYAAAVQVFWNRLATTVVGHWAMDNGVSEFRLVADILVDPRQAMVAIGQPVDESAGSTIH